MDRNVLEGIEISAVPSSHEHSWRINGMRFNNQEQHERAMLNDAAKRVVFANCLTHCNVEDLKNFNGKFYYTMNEERACLEKCHNAKMLLHFGEEEARQNRLFMDFEKMKLAYQSYEKWNPNAKQLKKFEGGYTEEKVESVTEYLLDQTRRARQQKF